MSENLIIPKDLKPKNKIKNLIKDFLKNFSPIEIVQGGCLTLYKDIKSDTFYLVCHLTASELINNADLEATLDLDDEDNVIYKLNREISEDKSAFITMQEDARNGRSFEDMVIEYDKSYRKEKPLKVYGGQHRIKAIKNIFDDSKNFYHGIRVYFDLTKEQKVEIATINNTSIAVPNDLLDRMREQLLGSELRDWCQNVGLLQNGQDFSDRKSPDSPTVRIARTLLVNFYTAKEKEFTDFHQPKIAKSGGVDDEYFIIRKKINWKDKNLIEMGKAFANLHKMQKEIVTNREEDRVNEFARKALSLTVVASWAYASGLFQKLPDNLKKLYDIPETATSPEDPLNAKALSKARLKGSDPDTYRGLGARSEPGELGRMLEVFIILCSEEKAKKITLKLANAAIQSYEAKRSTQRAKKAIGSI